MEVFVFNAVCTLLNTVWLECFDLTATMQGFSNNNYKNFKDL